MTIVSFCNAFRYKETICSCTLLVPKKQECHPRVSDSPQKKIFSITENSVPWSSASSSCNKINAVFARFYSREDMTQAALTLLGAKVTFAWISMYKEARFELCPLVTDNFANYLTWTVGSPNVTQLPYTKPFILMRNCASHCFALFITGLLDISCSLEVRILCEKSKFFGYDIF